MKKILFLLFIVLVATVAILFFKQDRKQASNLPIPTSFPTNIPSGTVLPALFIQTSWIKYTSTYLGVSFSYPPDSRLKSAPEGPSSPVPGPEEDKVHQSVDIPYAYGYIVRITKIVTSESLANWVAANDWNFRYKSAIEYATTFAGLPAILSVETPDFVESAQVPENVYYVKTNSNTLYQIKYAIPLPPDKHEADEEKQMDAYIPQILGSIKFL